MLEARLSDTNAMKILSEALENIVHYEKLNNDRTDPRSYPLSRDNARDLYNFIIHYLESDGTVVTASDLKKEFDLRLFPALTDLARARQMSAQDAYQLSGRYWRVPVSTVLAGGAMQVAGFHGAAGIAYGVAFLASMALFADVGMAWAAKRYTERFAGIDVSFCLHSLPPERFADLLVRAARPYREMFVVGMNV